MGEIVTLEHAEVSGRATYILQRKAWHRDNYKGAAGKSQNIPARRSDWLKASTFLVLRCRVDENTEKTMLSILEDITSAPRSRVLHQRELFGCVFGSGSSYLSRAVYSAFFSSTLVPAFFQLNICTFSVAFCSRSHFVVQLTSLHELTTPYSATLASYRPLSWVSSNASCLWAARRERSPSG